jgi:hypothetical protein
MVNSPISTWSLNYATNAMALPVQGGATITIKLVAPNQILVPPSDQTVVGLATASVAGVWLSLDKEAKTIFFAADPPASTPASMSTVTQSSAMSPSTQTTPTTVLSSAPANPSPNTPQNGATAATSSTSTSTPKPTSQAAKSGGTGLSTGATAGIAIGCLAAGALLAGLILWFCWRRKKTPKSQYSGANTYAMASQEKGFSANTVPLAGVGHTAVGIGGGLPQPLEDKAITGDISKISNAIKNHVQSYYHTSRISPGLIDYDDLHAFGPTLPISVGTLTTLMGNAATREIALRFIIAWVVVSRLQPSKDPAKSLLPSEVAQCYQTISTGDRGFQGTSSIERANVQLLIFTQLKHR